MALDRSNAMHVASWGLITVLCGYYLYHVFSIGFDHSLAKVPQGVLSLAPRAGLGSFLFGVAIMNIPTHISNMSIWQRISGSQHPEIIIKGFRHSVWSLFFSWGLLALLACFAYTIVTPQNNQTLLTDMLIVISNSAFGKVILFFVVLGLYGAMLSTASTNLIVVAHTVSEDIVAKFQSSTLMERIHSRKEFVISRIILIASTFVAVFLVEGLKYFNFSIADLVFAIYGGSLALFPPIIFSLLSERSRLIKVASYANCSVILGFSAGWGAAIYGKIIGNGNLIFLSPGFSILVSFSILVIGFVVTRNGSGD